MSNNVIEWAMQRAAVLAVEAGSTVVDMDLWLHARTVARLPGLDDEQEMRP
ncbi:MAG TPA: hypothetical protein VGP82_06565 [Ktedonobacterales bacterium]|nr:hypothetical protein [Ktedonobacterales bacterium]